VDAGSAAAAAERRERATILESRSRARAPGRRKRCGLPPRWRAGERRRRSMDGGWAGSRWGVGLRIWNRARVCWWRFGRGGKGGDFKVACAAVEGNENEVGREGSRVNKFGALYQNSLKFDGFGTVRIQKSLNLLFSVSKFKKKIKISKKNM
jgi:hypothetical protein